MSKFFFLTQSDLIAMNQLFSEKNNNTIVLSRNNRFADVVRYNSKYDTLVLLTIPVSDI